MCSSSIPIILVRPQKMIDTFRSVLMAFLARLCRHFSEMQRGMKCAGSGQNYRKLLKQSFSGFCFIEAPAFWRGTRAVHRGRSIKHPSYFLILASRCAFYGVVKKRKLPSSRIANVSKCSTIAMCLPRNSNSFISRLSFCHRMFVLQPDPLGWC